MPTKKTPITIKAAILTIVGGGIFVILGSIITPYIQHILETDSSTPTASPSSVSRIQITPFTNRAREKIFFLRDKDYYVMDYDGSNLALIADYSQTQMLCPAISPDGKKILFNSSFEEFTDLYTINSDGRNLKNITNSREYNEVCASWSPDQKEILFYLRYSDDNSDLAVIDSDGRNQTILTSSFLSKSSTKHIVSDMAWSPDSKRIVFNSDRDVDDEDSEIYIYEFATGDITAVTDNDVEDYRASWSPDGTKIIYTERISGNNTEIFMVDLTTGVFPVAGINLTNNPAHDTGATWSPDNTNIAFISNRDGNEEIYIMSIDGTNILKLTNSLEAESWPRWIK